MKRIVNYLIAMALVAFTFTSCEDVPNPFGQILPPSGEEEAEVVDPAGSGTQADPFNIAAIQQEAAKLAIGETSTADYYFKGIVSNVKYQFDKDHGTATFFISDSGTTENQFQVYSCLFLGNKNWVEGDAQIKEGDEVIICGKLTNYNGTLETASKKAFIYSLNGKTEGGGGSDTPTPTPTEAKAVSVADFLAAAESTSDWYQLTGTIKNLKDGDQYGNFDIEDASGSVYVYGLLSEKGGEKKKFQELVAAKGIKNGSKITIIGNRGAYNGTAQVTNAYFVSIEEGGGGGETPTPTEAKAVSVADFNAAAESDEVWYQLTGTVKNLKDGDQYGKRLPLSDYAVLTTEKSKLKTLILSA